MSYLHDTRPHQPVIVRRRRGCGLSILLVLLFACTLMVFSCGLCMAVYLVFPPAPVDILVMGLDARGNEGVYSRTDSIMLIGIQPNRLNVSLLSIPRDLFINVPGYGQQRINTINVLGEQQQPGYGPILLSAAIAESFGVQPDRYIRLNFEAFTELIDAVGGVVIDVPNPIVDYDFPADVGSGTQVVRFDAGQQYMDGRRALIYARTRHADDDYQRANRQQQVVSALVSRLLNPLHWGAVIGVLNRYVETDLTAIDFIALSPVILINAGRFDQLVIDRSYILPGAYGAIPNYNALRPWLESRFD
jgi:LCP family protein required for cell wall assembly